MGKFINLNNTHIFDITEIQSIEFTAKEIGTLYPHSKLAKRYTQLTGKKIADYPGTKFEGTYDQIEIELKSGHIILIEDFDLKKLREYLLSLLESVIYFECAELKYRKPDSNVSIDGEIEVTARLQTEDEPLNISLRDSESIDVRIEK
ncbi:MULTISPECIES: hypothetical protein [unclassified Microcoleus]|uniref:hypothetical protein n=1 Tax=unclassified Microcoleus TaxID=2642155 RepID=UPI002FD5364E